MEERLALLGLAKDAVHHGMAYRQPPQVRLEVFPERLRQAGATFVTLKFRGQLRGCIGRLEATRAVAEDVAHNAFAAAYLDGRFSPVGYHELEELSYHISLLSPAEPILFSSREGLIRELRASVDGLILEEDVAGKEHRGTFLPAVWETVPEPSAFLEHLLLKAGLKRDYWSPTVRVWRYTTQSVE